jgi:hypothetical protein
MNFLGALSGLSGLSEESKITRSIYFAATLALVFDKPQT